MTTTMLPAVANGESETRGAKKRAEGVLVRDISFYSPVQESRLGHEPLLPSVFHGSFKLVHGPPSSAAGNAAEIEKLFPCLFGQPSVELLASERMSYYDNQKLKIGVVYLVVKLPVAITSLLASLITLKSMPRGASCMDSEEVLQGL
jgi:pyrophosphate--fructose-6-phosphate 1-phosphotransferase